MVCCLFIYACSDSEPTPPAPDVGDTGSGETELCPTAQSFCGDRCVDLSADPNHCGTCNSVCDVTETCTAGTCDCFAPLQRCGGTCSNFQHDENNCGGCGIDCSEGETCIDGRCSFVCSNGLTACGTGCANTSTDMQNCGGCERVCSGGDNQSGECRSGACHLECEPGWHDLDGARGCEYFCDPADAGDEVCDGQDNDCNGFIDEQDPGYQKVLCPHQDGVCGGAFATCTEEGRLAGCTREDYALSAGDSFYEPGLESWCDGIDNNCSGTADENCCTFEDMPIVAPVGGVPPGWESATANFFRMGPINDGPFPMLAGTVEGFSGGIPVSAAAIVRFPVDGGHATVLHEWDKSTISLGDDAPRLLDAVWHDGIVAYLEFPEESLHRVLLDSEGNVVSDQEVVLPPQFESFSELRAAVRGDEGESVLLRGRLSGQSTDILAFGRVSGAGVFTLGATGDTGTPWLVSIATHDDWSVACAMIRDRDPALYCYELSSDLEIMNTHVYEANTGVNLRNGFVQEADGYILYFPEPDQTSIFSLSVNADGGFTRARSSLGTTDGVVGTGPLPGPRAAIITIPSWVPEEQVEFVVSIPSNSGRSVARFPTPTAPLGIGIAAGRSYVFVPSLDSTDPEQTRMPWAFPLSRDGVALCNDIGE